VKAFLATSVLVATFYGEHERHEPSFALFLRHKKRAHELPFGVSALQDYGVGWGS